MGSYVIGFQDIDRTKISVAGGKGANLGELSRIEGISVPEGFCISTGAFKRVIGEMPSMVRLLEKLSLLKGEDRAEIRKLSGEVRRTIEDAEIPQDIEEEIIIHLSRLGKDDAYAVRSSATAEDLPGASFAGQQDTYLNVVGTSEVLKHVSRCWASLFTDRAVAYRIRNGFDHRKVQLSVVAQKMVFPQASGIMFTADPVTSNRKVLTIDAGFGLGEAVVSGLVNPDVYKARDGRVAEKKISSKNLAVNALKAGGTEVSEVEADRRDKQVLSDDQILQLERIGRRIEEHFGSPQDIEWCLADSKFQVLQSRPITTLYPIPESDDQENHVYLSVGHNQMMTDAMKPLGLSFFLMTTRAPMRRAGGRLFVDATRNLSTTAGRKALIDTFGKYDLLTKDALVAITERGDFIKLLPEDEGKGPGSNSMPSSAEQIEDDPVIVSELIRISRESVEELKRNIQTRSGTDLLDFILEDIQTLKKILFDPRSTRVIMAGMGASAWINENMAMWLGEKNAADTLSQSVPNNVTSEMGLALLDVADAIRPYPEVIGYLQQANGDDPLEGLLGLEGGKQAMDAICGYLRRYGMRCVGEIDITKRRWSEKPAMLFPMILSNIKNFEKGESRRKFEQGLREALKKEEELLERLKQLPGGERKAEDAKRMIRILRRFIGYREYPKYGMISRYCIYKQALLKEAKKLVQEGVIHEKEDIYCLTFEELREAVRTRELDYSVIKKARDEFRTYEKLTPPRVLTSEGEVISGKYRRVNLPGGAIAGLPVSSGTAEGRARVILKMEDADIEEGDILVTSFTDPSWTPLFVSVKGLVTEVGGLMTHGAVIAREYGLPAVVGVENATKLIRDGQRIRVNGTEGYVEMLD